MVGTISREFVAAHHNDNIIKYANLRLIIQLAYIHVFVILEFQNQHTNYLLTSILEETHGNNPLNNAFGISPCYSYYDP